MNDVGHNDPAAARALEGMREYEAGVIKEQAGRDDAIAGIIKYGAGLIEGRAGKSNNEFGDWIVAQELDRHPIFEERQERSAAMQVAEIMAHVAKETVDGTATVNPFRGCPNSRPTNIMKWWRKKHGTLWTMAEAKKVGERAAILLRERRDRLNERVGRVHVTAWLERLARDPFAFLMADDDHIYERALDSLEVEFGLRAEPPKPASATPSPVQAAPAPAPPAAAKAAPPQDRVQQAADRAEVQTLQKEVWRLRDKLDQLSTYLVEKPQPKAEDRPFAQYRYWQLPETIERRPKDVPPRQFVDPAADDPAFALRKEEFEQWLVRRREGLELQFQAREAELKKAFDDKVKARIEARMKEGPFAADWEDDPRTGRLKKTISELRARLAREVKLFDERLTEKTGAMPRTIFTALVNCLHTDRPTPTDKQRDEAIGQLTQWYQKATKRPTLEGAAP